MTSVEIELNKKRLMLLFLASVGFVALGFWIVLSPFDPEDSLIANRAVLTAAGAVSILMFGFAAIMLGRKIADTSPGLVIDSEGITDNSSGTSIGFIAWKDITSITSKVISTQIFIIISVNNPQDYINRTTANFKKKLYRSTYKTHGTPIAITAGNLSFRQAELLKLLQDRFKLFEEAEQGRPL